MNKQNETRKKKLGKAQQEMERKLQEEIAKVKEAGKWQKVVLARANKKKEEIEQQFAEKNQLQKLLIEAQQKANEADKKLEALRKEKDRLIDKEKKLDKKSGSLSPKTTLRRRL